MFQSRSYKTRPADWFSDLIFAWHFTDRWNKLEYLRSVGMYMERSIYYRRVELITVRKRIREITISTLTACERTCFNSGWFDSKKKNQAVSAWHQPICVSRPLVYVIRLVWRRRKRKEYKQPKRTKRRAATTMTTTKPILRVSENVNTENKVDAGHSKGDVDVWGARRTNVLMRDAGREGSVVANREQWTIYSTHDDG